MRNKKVFWTSLLALICIFGAFFIHWTLIVISVALMIFNQRELMKQKKEK